MPRSTDVAPIPPTSAPAQPPAKIGRPPKWATPAELEAAIDDYFAHCDAAEPPLPYTLSDLAAHMGTTRKRLCDYGGSTAPSLARDHPAILDGPDGPRFRNLIEKAKAKCEGWLERKLLTSSTQVAGAIFTLKNGYGWRDDVHIEHTGGVTVQIGTPLHPVPAPEADWDGLVLEAERVEPKG